MHLLSARQVPGADAAEAVDLAQSPGEIVIVSAADSELHCLATARAALGAELPSLRLTPLGRLTHLLSVDLWVERTVATARLVVLRLLGGRGYWSYGLERVVEVCRARRISLAVLPGDARADPELDGFSTLEAAACRRIWRYLCEGGAGNSEHCLRYLASLLGRPVDWQEPRPMPPAGLWRQGREIDLAELSERLDAWLVFYRALVQAGDTAPVDALLDALEERDLRSVGLFMPSLKDMAARKLIATMAERGPPRIVLATTGFTVGADDPLRALDRPVVQVVLAGETVERWAASPRGLGIRDLAMSVVLPEIDGRVLARAVSFKRESPFDALTETAILRHQPRTDRVAFTADLAAAWARLAATPAGNRRIALVLPNYPSRDGRLANGVGLDTPASAIAVLAALRSAGYVVTDVPADGDRLMATLQAGVTNARTAGRDRLVRARLPLDEYLPFFRALPASARMALEARWGTPERDPRLVHGAFPLAMLPLGNVVVGIQPARGYEVDPVATYHAPDLVPPHGYLAFYLWLREVWGAHAIIHLGKHGNLEWLPGKAVGLSAECWPELALGPLPHLYPFIVNDPGEGTQAKRRAAAVIVDHLTPPLTRAESYGTLRELEALMDELHAARELDPRRAGLLEREILDTSGRLGLHCDLALDAALPADAQLGALDNHLCELKELQIRDGLHVLGTSPTGSPRTDLLAALLRVPRGPDAAAASLTRALAADLGLDGFDPLEREQLGVIWTGPRPAALVMRSTDPWRSRGDTVERLELLARAVLAGEIAAEPSWQRTAVLLEQTLPQLAEALDRSGPAELAAVLAALDGRAVAPGPSGAPTRGRPEVLPTGRNFYSIDSRALPTPAAWTLGWRSAAAVVERYLQLHGEWPRAVAISAWGTANMRTGGDDIAQALALLGCRPVWDGAGGRVTGVEVLPLGLLDRPRVDVTFRVSGFFRDAFPQQLELLDDAVRAVAVLDEPAEQNPLAARAREETEVLVAAGLPETAARRLAAMRLFGSAPGAYGAGLQALIDQGGWADDHDLAAAYRAWGGFAYGRGLEGEAMPERLDARLARVELVLHNQDNREHDILDSDDYYQFEGGLATAVRVASGLQPTIFHNDHSRPESPRVRTLKEEIGLVVRGRATNPKWLEGVMRHGHKGAFEIAATVDYLFAFAATARIVEDHHFDALFEAYLADETVQGFMARHNPAALTETAARFREAIARGLWHPRRNDASALLDELAAD